MAEVTDNMPLTERLIAIGLTEEYEYTEYEFIGTLGDAYIDTGFKPNNNTRCDVEFDYLPITDDQWFFGARDGRNKNAFGFMCTNRNYRSDYENQTSTISASGFQGSSLYNNIRVNKNKDSCQVIGNDPGVNDLTVNHNSATFQSMYTLYIFGMNQGTSSSYAIDTVIKSFKLYDNGTLIRDFVPAMENKTEKVGMFDKISFTFFEAQGSGKMYVGNAVGGIESTQRDYSEYDGTEIALCKTVANVLGIQPANSLLDNFPVSTGLIKSMRTGSDSIYSINLETCSWSDMSKLSQKVNASNEKIFKQKLSKYIGTTRLVSPNSNFLNWRFILVGICHDKDADTGEKILTTWMLSSTPGSGDKNYIYYTNFGSSNDIWETSDLRTKCQNFYSSWSNNNLKKSMRTVRKYTRYGPNAADSCETEDKLFIASVSEMGGNQYINFNDDGYRYEYFTNNASRIYGMYGVNYRTRSGDTVIGEKSTYGVDQFGRIDKSYGIVTAYYNRIMFCI